MGKSITEFSEVIKLFRNIKNIVTKFAVMYIVSLH